MSLPTTLGSASQLLVSGYRLSLPKNIKHNIYNLRSYITAKLNNVLIIIDY